MKLLFDANLSPRLVERLKDVFPGSEHVYSAHDVAAPDTSIWKYAIEYGFTIVTKDADFDEMSQIHTISAKVVWIRRGNCPTRTVEQLLRANIDTIAVLGDPTAKLSVLVLL